MCKIALLSDLHFGKLAITPEFAVDGDPILDETNGGMSLKSSLIDLLLHESVDSLLIAGDLSSTGSPHEFLRCQDQIHEIADLARIDRVNVLWSVGNHDIDYNITDIYSRVTAEIKPDMSHSEMGHYYQLIAANAPKYCLPNITTPEIPGVVPFSGIAVRDEMVIFILNSGLCSARDQSVKHGKLTACQMNWFNSMVREYREDPRWKMVLLHHHPFNYPFPTAGLDISTLEEGSSFLDVCGENGINIVCHGHRHHPKAFTEFRSGWANPITFICAGSTSVNSQHRQHGRIPNCVHLMKLNTNNRDIFLYNFQFDHAEGWIPIKSNCLETPLDAEMFLGSLFTPSDASEAFALLVNHEVEQHPLPLWHELPPQLRVLPLRSLNSLIKTTLSTTHSVYGNYPDQVLISRITI